MLAGIILGLLIVFAIMFAVSYFDWEDIEIKETNEEVVIRLYDDTYRVKKVVQTEHTKACVACVYWCWICVYNCTNINNDYKVYIR